MLAEILYRKRFRSGYLGDMQMIEKISSLIRERGLTQTEVEKLCGLATNRISRWNADLGEPTARQILRIADLLNVPVRYLIDDAMERPEPDVSEVQQRILWLAEQVGYDTAAKRLAAAPEQRTSPAAKGQQGAGTTTTIIRNDQPKGPKRKRIG